MLHTGRLTQLAVPKPSLAEIGRERLLQRLTSPGDERLLALIAPSGYGKTTLLTQFTRASCDDVVWLSLTEEHLDVDVLQTDLEVACQKTLGWHETQSARVSLPDLATRLNAHFANVSLVLDGINHLSNAGGRWLERLIERLEEGNRVLVSGYTEPPLRFSRFIASGQAMLIGAEELAFTAAESRAYLTARGLTDQIEHWHQTLEGWPAGLALASTGVHRLHPKRLVEEALAQLSPELRQALPEAAVLPLWSEAAANQAGCWLPSGWLEAVRRSGLPLSPLGDDSFRPHSILRHALRADLQQRPERWKYLHLQTAEAARAAGDFITALQSFQAAGALEIALGLARERCLNYAKRLEYALIVRILSGFEIAQLDDGLRAFLGEALVQTGEVERGEQLLKELVSSHRADRRTWFTLGLIASRRGQYESQLEFAQRGLGIRAEVAQGTLNPSIITSQPSQPSAPVLELTQHLVAAETSPEHSPQLASILEQIQFIHDLRGLEIGALRHLGQLNAALAMAQGLAEQAEQAGNHLELALMLEQIQFIYDQLGQREARRETIERALALFGRLNMPARALGLQNELADLLRLTGRPEEALRLIEQAIPVAEREESRMQAFLCETRADIWVWLGEHTRAASDFLVAEQLTRKFKLNAYLSRILCKRAVSLMYINDTVSARLCLESAKLEAQAQHTEAQQFQSFAQGVRLWLEKAYAAADLEFQRVRAEGPDTTLFVRAQAFRAAIAQITASNAVSVQRLIKTIDQFGTDDVLRADLSVLREFFATLIGKHPSSLRWQRLLVGAPTIEPSAPCVQLEIRTLGDTAILVNDTAVRTPPIKALEVLSFLAMSGPCARDRIVDALWPEESQSSGVNYFKVLIRRLRAALQTHAEIDFDPLPFNDHVYRIDARLEVSHDALKLLTLLKTGDVRQALRVYCGPFLPEAESNWAETLRQRCLDELIASTLDTARNLESADPLEAGLLFERVIALDPFSEPAHSGLIRTHLSLGRFEAARVVYKKLERMLATEFNQTPSAAIQNAVLGHSFHP